MSLAQAITQIKGLGIGSAKKLHQFGIYTQIQLLFHLPIHYQDKTHLTPLSEVVVGQLALLELTLEKIEKTNHRQKQLLCYLTDEQGRRLLLRFFYWREFQASLFSRGQTIQCFGEVSIRQLGLEMVHPEYSILSINQPSLLSKTLSPVYPNTLGIAPIKLKKWIKQTIELMHQEQLVDILSSHQIGAPSLAESITTLHYPHYSDLETISQWQHPAQKRLIFDELCAKNLALLQVKQQRQTQYSQNFPVPMTLNHQLKQSLEFKLTQAQNRVINEIQNDLNKNQPMMRLLQGDVGSGKTIVSIFASLSAITSGYQVAMMVPTEILAKQHFKIFNQYLSPLNIKCALLLASQTKLERQHDENLCQLGQAMIVIGTHTLFQESAVFKQLGLVIIDEQHKFGVHQRLKLTKKAKHTPHQLIMTATPIPRSLAMSAYADLETSVIDELPKNRKLITTVALSNQRKTQVFEKIKQVCSNKQQVYWVCTLIDDSEILPMQSANTALEQLKLSLPNLKIALIHGKLKKEQKQTIMHQFYQKNIDVLIATTVIEVGVDVPNASLMVIENAERLGLAQLHQLRGRVGRDSIQSVCILMYGKPLTAQAKLRLDILRQSNDGFVIAQKDLELRGPGEILGSAQTGAMQFKIADIVRDVDLLTLATQVCPELLTQNIAQQNVLITRWCGDDQLEYGHA